MRLTFELRASAQSIFAVLVGVELAMLVLDSLASCCGLVRLPELRHLVDITEEANLPTWFSSTQAMLVGVVALTAGVDRRRQGHAGAASGWFLVGAFFVYLGIDDAAQIHERVSTAVAMVAEDSATSGYFFEAVRAFKSYHWQVIFLPVFAGFAVFMLAFLLRELDGRDLVALFLAGMAIYVVAVVLDYLDGSVSNYTWIVQRLPYSVDEVRHLSRAVEEFLEMLGTTCYLLAFLVHRDRVQGQARGA